ncbi:hypothetical protein [Planococcus glaciei]|uniref:hypothetical protein n=1 Tax=Planococcus glaciei TaxID=459472 RepID=UPI001C732B4A|nr:hypothetical protein [Planococcus glaciei]MBX0315271.1 hypothetical protein [Planococcus glaciei]
MKTAFGELLVEVKGAKGEEIEADIRCIEKKPDSRFPVDGRLLIEITVSPERVAKLTFSCRFHTAFKITGSDVETGEHLELKSWYHDKLKWRIGTVDGEWLAAFHQVTMEKIDYLEDDLSATLLGIPVNESFLLPFAVSWKTMKDPEAEDHYTWFMANPAEMYRPRTET